MTRRSPLSRGMNSSRPNKMPAKSMTYSPGVTMTRQTMPSPKNTAAPPIPMTVIEKEWRR